MSDPVKRRRYTRNLRWLERKEDAEARAAKLASMRPDEREAVLGWRRADYHLKRDREGRAR